MNEWINLLQYCQCEKNALLGMRTQFVDATTHNSTPVFPLLFFCPITALWQYAWFGSNSIRPSGKLVLSSDRSNSNYSSISWFLRYFILKQALLLSNITVFARICISLNLFFLNQQCITIIMIITSVKGNEIWSPGNRYPIERNKFRVGDMTSHLHVVLVFTWACCLSPSGVLAVLAEYDLQEAFRERKHFHVSDT